MVMNFIISIQYRNPIIQYSKTKASKKRSFVHSNKVAFVALCYPSICFYYLAGYRF